jgi:4-hydroxybenzoate polyprenyltransferase
MPSSLPRKERLREARASSISAGLSRIKLFLALSRTPHALLDLAAPALAALLWLGRMPPLKVTALGLLTVFAGYTAVYALNDVVDYRVDREKLGRSAYTPAASYLDALFMRHPLAQGQVSYREGLMWTGAWALVALTGAWLLNPVCALIFLAGCTLEAAYCLLLKVSHLRVLVSGLVKTLGGLAGVFAVDPSPQPAFLVLLLLWLSSWEIGGQNIPADWHDLEEDRALGARTIPVRYGLAGAGRMAVVSLSLAVLLSVAVFRAAPGNFPWITGAAAVAWGFCLLLWPARRLLATAHRDQAAMLFNRASYYPLALLATVLVSGLAR